MSAMSRKVLRGCKMFQTSVHVRLCYENISIHFKVSSTPAPESENYGPLTFLNGQSANEE